MFILHGEVKGQGQRRAEKGGQSEQDSNSGGGVLLVDQRENFKVLQSSSSKNTHS